MFGFSLWMTYGIDFKRFSFPSTTNPQCAVTVATDLFEESLRVFQILNDRRDFLVKVG